MIHVQLPPGILKWVREEAAVDEKRDWRERERKAERDRGGGGREDGGEGMEGHIFEQ